MARCFRRALDARFPRLNYNEASAPSRKQIPCLIANLSNEMQIPSGFFDFICFDQQRRIHRYGLQIFNIQLRSHRAHSAKAADLTHRFVENGGDNSAVNEPGAALIFRAQLERSANALGAVVLLECELHSASVRAAAAKT